MVAILGQVITILRTTFDSYERVVNVSKFEIPYGEINDIENTK